MIEAKWFFKSDDGKWLDGATEVGVVEHDSHPTQRALMVDGRLHIVVGVEPFCASRDGTNGIEIGYLCFPATPGVEYQVHLDKEFPQGEEVERYDRNGVTVLGFASECLA